MWAELEEISKCKSYSQRYKNNYGKMSEELKIENNWRILSKRSERFQTSLIILIFGTKINVDGMNAEQCI